MIESKPLVNGQVVEPGTFSRAHLKRSRTGVEKAFAWAILVLGWAGSVSTAHGGWLATITAFSLGATLIGLAMQALLTWLEWAYADVWYIAWPARAVDALLTALGYGFLFVGGMASLIAVTGVSSTRVFWLWWELSPAGWVAWVLIYLLSLAVAWYPEHTLVR